MTSFNFVWEGAKPASGKVFAKKKTSQTLDSEKKQTSTFSFQNQSKNIEKKVGSITEVQSNLSSGNFKNTWVKRKGKKDKLAAKIIADESETSVTNTKFEKKKHTLFSEKNKFLNINTNVKAKSLVEKVFSANQSFNNLNIHKHIVSNLQKHGFTKLTCVQEKSVPVVLSGQNVLIRSQTGSGKTLAYAVPILDALQSINPRIERSAGVQAIIIVPTRELALQTHELFSKINTFQWIVASYLCGGENRNTEKNRLRKGVHILISTPGRLLDHILHTASFRTSHCRCLVLDEADRLLDMGFKKDIVKIVEELDNKKADPSYDPLALLKGNRKQLDTGLSESTTEVSTFSLRNPKSSFRQTILLSATLTKGVAELAEFTMKNHVYVDALDDSQTAPEHMIIPDTVKQEFIITYVKHRLFTLSAILAAKSKQNSKVFVFMATSQMVEYHYELFSKYLKRMPVNRGKLKYGDVVLLDHMPEDSDGSNNEEEEEVLNIPFFKLHGSMDQSYRKDVFTRFRAAKNGVLFCTDVAARGIDVPEADCIIQYTGPQSDEDYLHRVGRTGRAGKSGLAIIFLTHEEQDYVTRLQQHKVFLNEHKPDDFLKHLCDLMEEGESERAATALQQRFEKALLKNKSLHKLACFAYSSWARFYNTYPGKLRSIFDFKNVNLGHYVTSFAIQDPPSTVAKIVRGQMTTTQPKKLNSKLATHEDDGDIKHKQKRKLKSSLSLISEFSSGLESKKKRKKMKN